MNTRFVQYGSIVDIITYEKDITNRTKKHKSADRVLLKYQGLPRYQPRRFDSIIRAKKICLRRVSCAITKFGSPLFITLTFNGDASDVTFASEALATFQRRLRAKYSNAISIFVPELSPKGRIHFHGLIFNLPQKWGDKRSGGRTISTGTERKTRTLAKLYRVGFVDAQQTNGSPKLASYISKYLTKAGKNPLFDGIRLVRISRGFPKEWVSDGQHGEWLASKFLKYKESYFWEAQSKWLGKIKRHVYYTDTNLSLKPVDNLLLDTIPEIKI